MSEKISPPKAVYLCMSERCWNRGSVLVFLGSGPSTLFEPSHDRDKPWCYTCGSKAMGPRYVLVDDAARFKWQQYPLKWQTVSGGSAEIKSTQETRRWCG